MAVTLSPIGDRRRVPEPEERTMRLRWWRRPEPVDPKHGRDPAGRLHDGDRVRPEGWGGWADLLRDSAASDRAALTEHTAVMPIITPAARMRGWGGGSR